MCAANKSLPLVVLAIAAGLIGMTFPLGADTGTGETVIPPSYQGNLINIRSTNGKFYAYIVLLFNENPHFVNLIQADSVSLKMMQREGFHVIEYKNYLKTIPDVKQRKIAEHMLEIYLSHDRLPHKALKEVERTLEGYNVILRFTRDNAAGKKLVLDYCIYGRKKLIRISHPLFNIREKVFNIQPLIYYDEFSTSNSTFYFDMIYINPEEVQNDYLIAKNILAGKSVKSMFFVGARVSEDIATCLKRAFAGGKPIKSEILRMFEIHELTHKLLNNHYNFYDQVIGEELALSSTIYANPYLGLSVLYSYLDYNVINPHRIAAMNFVRFAASRTRNTDMIDNPSLVYQLGEEEILKLAREHFNAIIKTLKRTN